jgi:hypothetical protein
VTDTPELLHLHTYLTYRMLLAGADVWTAMEAVASTMLAHPEWDQEETLTWEGWQERYEASAP